MKNTSPDPGPGIDRSVGERSPAFVIRTDYQKDLSDSLNTESVAQLRAAREQSKRFDFCCSFSPCPYMAQGVQIPLSVVLHRTEEGEDRRQ